MEINNLYINLSVCLRGRRFSVAEKRRKTKEVEVELFFLSSVFFFFFGLLSSQSPKPLVDWTLKRLLSIIKAHRFTAEMDETASKV